MIDISSIAPATPVTKLVKICRDEDRKNKPNSDSKFEKKQPPLDEDAGDVQHIDEII